jgi:hypothetical protein
MIGKCKLCLNENHLKNSHIIPEYFYKPLYDKKNRYFVFSNKEGAKTKFEQKGIREYLLCNNCEIQFSKYERYISLIGENKNIKARIISHNCYDLEGVDYKTMKLFQLSVLWRASVSSLDFFSEINLNEDEEVLRQMLLVEEPGGFFEYGCQQFEIINDQGEFVKDLIYPPVGFEFKGLRYCRFLYGGRLWIYLISNKEKQHFRNDLFLQESNKMRINSVAFNKLEFVFDYFEELYRKGKI